MTTEELKAWRIKVCTDLANGVQYQMRNSGEWDDVHACSIAAGVFNESRNPDSIRIKPEPRKVWVGWHAAGQCLVPNEHGKSYHEKQWGKVKWQIVEEPQ